MKRLALIASLLCFGAASCASGAAETAESLGEMLSERAEVARNAASNQESAIASCMRESGFEYVGSTGAGPPESLFSLPNMSSAEYAAEYGLGFSTTIEDRTIVRVNGSYGLADRRRSSPIESNREYLRELTPAELDQWWIALQGFSPAEDPPAQAAGCIGRAVETLAQMGTLLGSQLDELEAQIASDPRIVQLDQQWSRCMAERGWDFPTSASMRDDFFAHYEQAARSTVANDMIELQERERSAAVAAVECAEVDEDARRAVRAEYEAEFVESTS